MKPYCVALADWDGKALSLDDAANLILRTDRRTTRKHSFAIDLLSQRDAARRDRRRQALVERNMVVLDMFVSTSSIRSAEDHLMDKQSRALTALALQRILRKFADDRPVKIVIATAVLGDIALFRTKELAEACQMREDVVRAAKERLRYYARTQMKPTVIAA